MARTSQKKLPANAFTIAQRADRWVAFGEDGQPVGMFRDRGEAQRVVDARAEVYRIVTGAKPGKAKPRADRAKTLADTSIAKAGRKLAEQTPELLESNQKMLAFAAKATQQPAAATSQGGLTLEDLEKALAKQKRPKGTPVSIERARRSKTPPTLAQASVAVSRKKRGSSDRSRRERLGRGAKQSEQPRGGGFVLEDPSANLSAHDLTRMLSGNLGGNPAGPVLSSPPAQPPAQAVFQSPPPRAQPLRAPVAAPVRAPAATRIPRLDPSRPQAAVKPVSLPLATPSPLAKVGIAKPPAVGRNEERRRKPRGTRPDIAKTAAQMRDKTPPPVPKLSDGAGSPIKSDSTPAAGPGPRGRSGPRDDGLLDALRSVFLRFDRGLGNLFTRLLALIGKKLAAAAQRKSPATASGGSGAGTSKAIGFAERTRRAFHFARKVADFAGKARGGKAAAAGAGAGRAAVAAGADAAAGAGVAGGVAVGAVAGVGVVIGLGLLAKKLAEAPSRIEAFTGGLLEGSRDLRQLNGSIANSFAMVDRQQLVLAGRQASGTSGTTRSLAKSEMKLREALQPQKELLANISNGLGTGLNQVGSALAEIVNSVFFIREINAAIRLWLNVGPQRGPPPFQFLDEVAKGRWGMPQNQNPRQGP